MSGALNREMRITVFPTVSGAVRNTTWMSLAQFAANALATVTAPEKTALPMLKLAAFGDKRSVKGSLRHDRNVLEVSGIEIDYDGETLSPDAAEAILRDARIPGIVYTSPSHTPERPRFRILLAFSTPRPPDWRARMVSRLAGLFPVELAPESWTLSQAYFYGSVIGQPATIVLKVDGPDFVAIDLRDDLDATAKAKPSSKSNGGVADHDDWFDVGDNAGNEPVDVETLFERIRAGGRGTHNALVSLAGWLARHGSTEDAAVMQLRAALLARPAPRTPSWDKHLTDVPRIVEWTMKKEAERRQVDGEADPWAQAAQAPAAAAQPDEGSEPEPNEWPEPMALAAFHGPLGEATAEIMPHTEADPHAVLLSTIVYFGNKIGHGPYYFVRPTRHRTNLSLLIAGSTSRSRKGTSRVEADALFASDALDPWLLTRVQSGLVSGEGLINAVRDERTKKNKDGVIEILDEGVADKRLLVVEEELTRVLTAMKREGSTLGQVMNIAWDRDYLQTMAKVSPLKATGVLVSVIAHVTIDELRETVDRISLSNGFLNRFLLCAVKRARRLSRPTNPDTERLATIGASLDEAIRAARLLGAVEMTPAAAELWDAEYHGALTDDHPGLYGSLIARAEAHTVRMALIYALADQCPAIDLVHLQAALAVWKYSQDSANVLFGSLIGDPTADALLGFLRTAGTTGMTRTELYNAMGRYVPAGRIQAGLRLLVKQRRARVERVPGVSRPGPATERWVYLPRRRP